MVIPPGGCLPPRSSPQSSPGNRSSSARAGLRGESLPAMLLNPMPAACGSELLLHDACLPRPRASPARGSSCRVVPTPELPYRAAQRHWLRPDRLRGTSYVLAESVSSNSPDRHDVRHKVPELSGLSARRQRRGRSSSPMGNRSGSGRRRFRSGDPAGADFELRDLGDRVQRPDGEQVGGLLVRPMVWDEDRVLADAGDHVGFQCHLTAAGLYEDQIAGTDSQLLRVIRVYLDERLWVLIHESADPARLCTAQILAHDAARSQHNWVLLVRYFGRWAILY